MTEIELNEKTDVIFCGQSEVKAMGKNEVKNEEIKKEHKGEEESLNERKFENVMNEKDKLNDIGEVKIGEEVKEEKKQKDEKMEEENKTDEFLNDSKEELKSDKDDDERYSKMSAEELFSEGKKFFKSKNFDKAADVLSRATEKRTNECKSLAEDESDLCTYYLWYADSLLTKEENNNELFDFEAENKVSSLQKDETEDKKEHEEDDLLEEQNDETVSDEQLAFEMFEMARKAYRMKIALQKQKNKKEKEEKTEEEKDKDQEATKEKAKEEKEKEEEEKLREEEKMIDKEYLSDLSYVHMRLGDIQLLNDFFEEAADEYREAYKIRKRNIDRFGLHDAIAPTVSLAQAELFSGKQKKAFIIFQEALQLVIDVLLDYDKKGVKDEIYQKLKESEEDLQLQIEELKNKIAEEEKSGKSVTAKGSQYDVKASMPITTSTFDKPRLPADSAIQKIEIDVIRKTKRNEEVEAEKEENTTENKKQQDEGEVRNQKKRRIDLTKFKQENENNTHDSPLDNQISSSLSLSESNCCELKIDIHNNTINSSLNNHTNFLSNGCINNSITDHN